MITFDAEAILLLLFQGVGGYILSATRPQILVSQYLKPKFSVSPEIRRHPSRILSDGLVLFPWDSVETKRQS